MAQPAHGRSDTSANEARLREATKGSRFRRVQWVEETGSTNDDLLAAAVAAEPEQVLIADYQKTPKARRGRSWSNEPLSALLMSILIRNDPESDLAKNPFWLIGAVGLAICDATQELLDSRNSNVKVGLKWPNDVLIGERKAAGILSVAHGDAVVVGCGLNVNRPEQVPQEILERACWINDYVQNESTGSDTSCAKVQLDRAELAQNALKKVEQNLELEIAELTRRWKQVCVTLGANVRIELDNSEKVYGTAVDIESDGALVLETRNAKHSYRVGDVVHLRGIEH